MHPVLTWRYLFDGDLAYQCEGCPPWLRDKLEGDHKPGGEEVLVTWNSRASQWPDLQSLDGLVAINDDTLNHRTLESTGFHYARHFAVIPSMAAPRLFMPLDAPRVTAGAFDLYKPVRWQSRWKHWGAKLAARAGRHFWYRDHIWIARRSPPALERLLAKSLVHRKTNRQSHGSSTGDSQHDDAKSRRFRVAISAGNTEAVRNRKLTMAVMDIDGSAMGYAKLSLSPLTRARVQHEARVLSTLARHSQHVPAPALLVNERLGDETLIVTSPLHGRVPSPQLSESHRQFLKQLDLNRRMPVSETGFVQSRLARRSPPTDAEEQLCGILRAIVPMLESIVLPATMVHRDFAPWNLRQHRQVIAALDWEYAELEGPPLLDELHYLLAVEYFVKRTTPAIAVGQFLRYAITSPWGLLREQVYAIQALYLLDHLLLLLDEGYADDYPKFRWWREVLTRLLSITGLLTVSEDPRMKLTRSVTNAAGARP